MREVRPIRLAMSDEHITVKMSRRMADLLAGLGKLYRDRRQEEDDANCSDTHADEIAALDQVIPLLKGDALFGPGFLKAFIFPCPPDGENAYAWLVWLRSVGAKAGDGSGKTGAPIECRANTLEQAAENLAANAPLYVRGPDGDRFRGAGLAKLAHGVWIEISREDISGVMP